MKVIWEECPRVYDPGAHLCKAAKAAYQVLPVPIISENPLPVQAPNHHMMEDSRGIESWSTRHSGLKASTKRL